MEGLELDTAIEDLETRVERLRALYEQFFMGIEKIPPNVVQKDVDRRLYQLRRAQIRNTARRFKLQTIVQRYNTFQQYWLRIMREIENGTYRRHVLRAERTMGTAGLLTAAERKRLGLPEQGASPAANEPPEGHPPSDNNSDNTATALGGDGSPEGSSQSEAVSPETVRSPSSLAPPLPPSPRAVRAQIERDLSLLLDDEFGDLGTLHHSDLGRELDDPLLSSLPPPPRKKKSSLRAPTARSNAPASSSRKSTAPKRQPPDVPDPEPTQQGLGPATPRLGSPREKSPGDSANTPSSRRKSIKPQPVIAIESPRGQNVPPPQAPRQPLQPQAPGGVGAASPTTQAARGLRLPAQSAVAGRGLPPAPKPAVPSHNQPLMPPPKPATAAAPPVLNPIPPAPKSPPDLAVAAGPPSPRGLPSIRESVIPRAPRDSVRPRGEEPASSTAERLAKPAARNSPNTSAPAVTPPRASPPRPVSTSQGSDEGLLRSNVERIAEKMREARKVTHEPLAVSVDALTAKLSATKATLQKSHPGKTIDFDVVIKDGKAIVKPIVR